MAKRNAPFQKTVPVAVVAVVAALTLGIFLHYYMGADQSSVLGVQSSSVYSQQKGGGFGWLLNLFSLGGVRLKTQSKPETPQPQNTKETGATTTQETKIYESSVATDAEDAQILQDIKSTEDDGGVSQFKELEQIN